MALRIEDKKALVAEVNEVAARALSAVAAEYRGLSAGEFDLLRKTARENGIYLHVVKNTLARRALQGTTFECMGRTGLGRTPGTRLLPGGPGLGRSSAQGFR
jgi:large subunit ribosomal protein L10